MPTDRSEGSAFPVAIRLGIAMVMLAINAGGTALAQGYPDRAVRIIVPFSPGGSTDTLARLMAQKLGEMFGQQVVVDNRSGAGAQIGTELASMAAPNGYTILNVDSSFTSNPSLFAKLPYDTLRDFAPISLLALGPVTLVVHPSVPAKTLKELLVLANSRPKLFTFATGNLGSASWLGALQFKSASGIDLLEISYKSVPQATLDTLGGQVPMMFGGPSSLAPLVQAGRLRALAVTGENRISVLSDVPTFIEAGLGAVSATSVWGSLAPAATPAEIINTLSGAMAKALQMPDVRQRISQLGMEPVGSTAAQFAASIRSELAKWAKAVKEANIRVQ